MEANAIVVVQDKASTQSDIEDFFRPHCQHGVVAVQDVSGGEIGQASGTYTVILCQNEKDTDAARRALENAKAPFRPFALECFQDVEVRLHPLLSGTALDDNVIEDLWTKCGLRVQPGATKLRGRWFQLVRAHHLMDVALQEKTKVAQTDPLARGAENGNSNSDEQTSQLMDMDIDTLEDHLSSNSGLRQPEGKITVRWSHWAYIEKMYHRELQKITLDYSVALYVKSDMEKGTVDVNVSSIKQGSGDVEAAIEKLHVIDESCELNLSCEEISEKMYQQVSKIESVITEQPTPGRYCIIGYMEDVKKVLGGPSRLGIQRGSTAVGSDTRIHSGRSNVNTAGTSWYGEKHSVASSSGSYTPRDTPTGMRKVDTTTAEQERYNVNRIINMATKYTEDDDSDDETSQSVTPVPTEKLTRNDTRKSNHCYLSWGYRHKIHHQEIIICQCDITQMAVDAIVNAANSRLAHAGGVAEAIAKVAGPQLQTDCSTIMSKKGNLKVREVVRSVPGNLPCKMVFHAVGPRWTDYSAHEKKRVEFDLLTTIGKCLGKAEEFTLTSIAMPAISSGLFGVPANVVATAFATSVECFCVQNTKLNRIYLVDLNEDILKCIQRRFSSQSSFDTLPNGEAASLLADVISPSRPPIYLHGASSNHPAYAAQDSVNFEKKFRHRKHDLEVVICKRDITKMAVDVIVNSSNPYLVNHQGVSKAIANAAGPELTRECSSKSLYQTFKVKDVIFTCAGYLPCTTVLHAIGPDWGKTVSKFVFEYDLTDTIKNCLQAAERRGYTSIALPSICSGGAAAPLDVSSRALYLAVSTFCLISSKLKLICITDTNQRVVTALEELFDKTSHFIPLSADDPRKPSEHSANLYTRKLGSSNSQPNSFSSYNSYSITTDHEEKNTVTDAPGNESIPDSPGNELIVERNMNKADGKIRSESTKVTSTENMDNSDSSAKVFGGGAGRKEQGTGPAGAGEKHYVGKEAGQTDPPAVETCVICLSEVSNPTTLRCKHTFCTECVQEAFKHKPVCPVCSEPYGTVTGTQPEGGHMDVMTDKWMSLPGYQGCGTIVITYWFPGGTQTAGHPNPGTPYAGTRRVAFLPDNDEGRHVLNLLRRAFDARLVFTIGRSATTGKEGQITWNDIHHKTNKQGGPTRFGYPDQTYLSRVQEELAAKGIR